MQAVEYDGHQANIQAFTSMQHVIFGWGALSLLLDVQESCPTNVNWEHCKAAYEQGSHFGSTHPRAL